MTKSEEFEYARSLLPNDMFWGEPITVAAVLRIAEAARRTVSGQEAVAWLVTSKRGMVRCAWTEKPSKEQLLASEFDGDTVTPLYAAPIPATEQEKS